MSDSMVMADDVPIAHTLEGGWKGEMPAPILGGCTEPLAQGAPDLRGTWKAIAVEQDGQPVKGHPLNEHVERVEQCGDRVVVTAGRIIHDMRVDGTLENGCNDVWERDLTTKIQVAAVFKDGRLDLHPGGVKPGVAPMVTREVVDGKMIWRYGPFRVTLRRVDTQDTDQQ